MLSGWMSRLSDRTNRTRDEHEAPEPEQQSEEERELVVVETPKDEVGARYDESIVEYTGKHTAERSTASRTAGEHRNSEPIRDSTHRQSQAQPSIMSPRTAGRVGSDGSRLLQRRTLRGSDSSDSERDSPGSGRIWRFTQFGPPHERAFDYHSRMNIACQDITLTSRVTDALVTKATLRTSRKPI